MILSINPDFVLFAEPGESKTEVPPKTMFGKKYKERLRYGALELLQNIHKSGIELWLYSYSDYSEKYFKGLFKSYGIIIANVVNAQRHNKEVQANHANTLPQIYPPRYRINLHIDGDTEVAESGKAHGFKVLLADKTPDWHIKLWEEIKRLKVVLAKK